MTKQMLTVCSSCGQPLCWHNYDPQNSNHNFHCDVFHFDDPPEYEYPAFYVEIP